MRKTLIALGVLGIAYLLYKSYMKDKQKPNVDTKPPEKTGDAVALAIKNAQNRTPRPLSIYEQNWQSFKQMKDYYNAEEGVTVAPAINAPKNGIF